MPEVTIERIGAQGDGIAQHSGKDIFVPFSLPGETVAAEGSGKRYQLDKVIENSPERVEPVCKHFGLCGGCQLQHWAPESYRQWKRSLLVEALREENIDFEPEDMISFADAARRRVVFSLARKDKDFHLGFSQRASHYIIDIEACPVLVSQTTEQLDDLKAFAKSIALRGQTTRLSVLATAEGLDLSVEGAASHTKEQKSSLIKQAIAFDFARLTMDNEIWFETRKPSIAMGQALVVPPPGGFLQAVEAAETEMTRLVCKHLSSYKSVADLYSGVGTFALRLAERSVVYAAEGDEPSLAALDRAWRETAGNLKRIQIETRNLERRPLGFQELKTYQGVVFDPPRAGAQMQSQQLAKSKVERVAAVSCNPKTLARDLSILISGGYAIDRLVPIDQFKYTPHMEVVALLSR